MASTAGEGAIRAPRVFVSYSHDSREHMDLVLALCDRFRREGIEADLDQYEPVPPEGWPLWTARKVEEANFVLIVCTENYRRRFDGREETGKGLGVRWEVAAVVQALYDAGAQNDKFLPILFNSADEPHIPLVLRGATRFLVSDEEGYEQLYRYVTGQPAVSRPEFGPLRPLPPKPRAMEITPVSAERRSPRTLALWSVAGLALTLSIAWTLSSLSSAWKPFVRKQPEAAVVPGEKIGGEFGRENLPSPEEPGERGLVQKEVLSLLEKFEATQEEHRYAGDLIKETLHYVQFFRGSSRNLFERSLLRKYEYWPTIKEVFTEKRIPLDFGYLALVESGFQPRAVGPSGAQGLWQLPHRIGAEYGLKSQEDFYDVRLSTIATATYLNDLTHTFGSHLLALAAYNAGEGKVRFCLRRLRDPGRRSFWGIRHCLPAETQDYVPKILAAAVIGNNPKHFGFPTEEEAPR